MSKHLHRLGSLLICGFPALLISVSATLLAQRPVPKPPTFVEASASVPDCIGSAEQGTFPLQPDAFYPNDGVSITSHEGGWRFMGRAWLAAQLCGPGTLSIQGIGQEAGNELPRLEISLDGEPLTSEAFSAQGRSVEVEVPHAGRLTMAYLNDYYLSEYRTVILDRVRLQNEDCAVKVVEGDTPQNIAVTSVTLVLEPVTFEICGPDILEMRAWAKVAQKSPPNLELSQGQQISTATLKPGYQVVRVPVTSGQVTLSISNPYAVELADRNLILQQLKFTPR